jgi:putative restriction endonuclease
MGQVRHFDGTGPGVIMQSSDGSDIPATQLRSQLRLQGARHAFDLLVQSAHGSQIGATQSESGSELHYLDVASGQALFSLCAVDGELRFAIHAAGLARVPGATAALEAGLGAGNLRPDGSWELRVARLAQAETLARLLFSTSQQFQPSLRSRHWRLQLSASSSPQIEGSYLWSAKKSPSRAARQLRVGLTDVAPGDIVFAGGTDNISAIGIALDRVRSSPDPARTSSDGWLVPMRFQPLSEPLTAAARPSRTRAARAQHELLELADNDAAALRLAAGGQVEALEEGTAAETDGELIEQAIEQQIWLRTDIEPLQKRRLSAARGGRGLFREQVERLESACRVTGILDRRYLRVTHIKPWSESNDAEKIDGANGLLLSPHIVHLFRRGHISFADNGPLLVSRHLNPYVVKAWNLRQPTPIKGFRADQRAYLAYHRERLFERSVRGRRTLEAGEKA